MKVQEKETKGRYFDQHKTRQLQAQLKRDRAAKEFDAQRAMEWAQVASNQLTIEANKRAAKEAQEAARRKNEEIVRQNILDRAKSGKEEERGRGRRQTDEALQRKIAQSRNCSARSVQEGAG